MYALKAIVLASALLAGTASFASASDEVDYEFSIHKPDAGRKVLRHRRAQSAKIGSNYQLEKPKKLTMTTEDQQFWDRMLQEDMGSMPPTAPPATAPPATAPPATAPPAGCPTRIEVECVEVGSGTPCSELQPPEGNTGDDCVKNVKYSYIMTNDGSTPEQIYTLVITRGDMTTIVTDIPEAIPTVILAPGETITAPEEFEGNICGEGGVAVFDTKADVITGPVSSIAVAIACESEEGVECKSISDDFNANPDPDACILDVIYTYTVSNTGQSDFNIILFTRERNGEFQDLMPLLETDVLVEAGGSTSVVETDSIDRCMNQNFATKTIVTKLPPVDLLCQDTAFYPSER